MWPRMRASEYREGIITMSTDYNGWKNRQTWNVSLWINNDESLYRAAVAFMQTHKTVKSPYYKFIVAEGMDRERTPDNIGYISTRLDYKALNEMMRELIA